jgi:hypothetical protein
MHRRNSESRTSIQLMSNQTNLEQQTSYLACKAGAPGPKTRSFCRTLHDKVRNRSIFLNPPGCHNLKWVHSRELT